MITIEPITPQKALTLKDVRLRALQDTPSAFGSTHAREALFTDEMWIVRATLQPDRVTYLAMDGQEACGIIGGFLNLEEGPRVTLVSMWVAPTHRCVGVGQQLVQAITGWAKAQSVGRLFLQVTNNNDLAIAFYQRIGFAKTGRTESYPNDPNLVEYEMSKDIS
ncbi:MAG: GNAT family N-acetyltransferase [Candidatus Latescibacteria bacterium]|nr:GNAT family N-acetyltransferase [Candidatus Latescibacterota bacterium]